MKKILSIGLLAILNASLHASAGSSPLKENHDPKPTFYDRGHPTMYTYNNGNYKEVPQSREEINEFTKRAKRFRNGEIINTVLIGAMIPALVYGNISNTSGRRLLTGLLLGWHGIETARHNYSLTQEPRIQRVAISPYIGDQPFIHANDEYAGKVIGGIILASTSLAWLACAIHPISFSRSTRHMHNHFFKALLARVQPLSLSAAKQ